MHDVFFQRFSAAGQKLGGEVLANQETALNQRDAAVAALPDGGFVLVWVSDRRLGTFFRPIEQSNIKARRFDSQGQPVGGEFQVNTGEEFSGQPGVAALADGSFTVVWSRRESNRPPASYDIYARAFGADARPSGEAFLVNTYTAGRQSGPRIAASGGSQFVVWTSYGQDGSGEGVYGRVLANGVSVGGEAPQGYYRVVRVP